MEAALILAPVVAVLGGAAWHQYWRGDPEWWVFAAMMALALAGGGASVLLTL